MKQCIRCARELPAAEFYRHDGMADGTLNKCKSCCRADAIRNRTEKRDYYREYDRLRASTQQRKQCLASRLKRYRASHPLKNAARASVRRAIASGRLQRMPCEVCGEVQVDAHHDDYSRALEVRWLCRRHHLEVHGNRIQEAVGT